MSDATPKWHTWIWSVSLGMVLLAAYLANGREIGTDDTQPTSLLVYALLRGDGLHLDRFRSLIEVPGFEPPVNVVRAHGHLASLHSPGASLVAAPIAWPHLAARDRLEPGWRRNILDEYHQAKRMSKFAAAVIAALIGVALDRALRRLGLGNVSVPAVLAAGLGSNLWAVASQSLWPHGPAALMLTLTVTLLLPEGLARWRLVAAGAAAGVLVACRSIDVVFAAAAFGYVALSRPRGLAWFLPLPLLIGVALVAYNLHTFGTVVGGQARLESLHPALHGVEGPWSGNLVAGLTGTLFSPSRGLFVFTPWVALALVLLPAYWSSLKVWPLLTWMLGALSLDLLMLSKYAVWWAGHCFGPRYWTDAIPLFAILLAFALDWCRRRCRPLLLVFALAVSWGLAVQAVGAFLYPSDWNFKPANVDIQHERLWNWRDSELTRCLFTSPQWRSR